MSTFEMIFLAIGLSMDAFAVSITQGLTFSKEIIKKAIVIALFFGAFQAIMPILGYLFGVQFQDKITSVDHWIAFVLLLLIGGKMIYESFGKETLVCQTKDEPLNYAKLFTLAVATSIDALAIGVSFAFLKVNIILAIILIGVTTFILSFIGVRMGCSIGYKYKSKAELFGGIILILIGLKILLEHLAII